MTDLKAFYERFHGASKPRSRIIRANDFMYGWVIRAIAPFAKDGAAFLDAGCGEGDIVLHAASRGLRCTGTDISERAVAACNESARRLGLAENARFLAGLIEEIELPLESFDLILCNQVIEHVPDDGGFLRRLHALLRADGRAVITVPSQEAPAHHWRKRFAGRDYFDEEVGHLRRYTADTFRRTVEAASFDIVTQYEEEGPIRSVLFTCRSGRLVRKIFRGPLLRIVAPIDFILMRWLHGAAHVIVAKRHRDTPCES